jgi:undecaprenyl-diphosphatase
MGARSLPHATGEGYGAALVTVRARNVLLGLLAAAVLTLVVTGGGLIRSAVAATLPVSAGVPSSVDASPRAAPQQDDSSSSSSGLSVFDAVVLGLVEGITEFLPVSSTGHLVVAEHLLGLDTTGDAQTSLDSYTIIIQFGAILAVIAIYRKRILDVLKGIIGRSESGRRMALALIVAFLPAGIVGLALGDVIDKHLLKPIPVAIAWIIGGIIVLLVALPLHPLGSRSRHGKPLDQITLRIALAIGVCQALALWPGVSRSLVTIVAGTFAGLTLAAAVEFSFLLGLGTLTAATGLELVKHGSDVVDTYGKVTPMIGIIVAGLAAWAAVRTLVAYLSQRDLSPFGWYRIGIGVITIILVITGVI